MELTGKIIAQMDARKGVSARGEWMAQDFVLETFDNNFPRKMVFTVFGADRLQRFNIQLGQSVSVSFDIDAHQYQDKWYNSIRAFDVRQIDPSTAMASNGTQETSPFPPAGGATAPFPPAQEPAAENSADDLPF